MLYQFSLKMHVGKPSIPIVKEGAKVKRGQLIAKADDGISTNLHSSVSGKVVRINDAIVIEGEKEEKDNFVKIDKSSSIAESAFNAGIVGAGGAGFPTHIKLKTEIPGGIVFANCAECEPGLEHNIYSIEKDPDTLIKGIKYAMESTKASKAVIGIKAKHNKAISILESALKKVNNIVIEKLEDIYPVGEERALIHAHTGKWLGTKELPSSGNFAVFNTETLFNIVDAYENHKPVIDKNLTIVGDFENKDSNSIVLENIAIGTPLSHLVSKYDIKNKYTLGEIVIGGPYTGKSSTMENAYVSKTSGGFIFTIELPIYEDNVGLLVCACGANEDRLRDIASKMKSNVVGVAFCKNIDKDNNKCLTPGDCPGQVQAVMQLKKNGAKRLIIANCSDCSNTVMCCAPDLNLGVYHSTDHIFRTIDKSLTRRL